jgi:hypothetical protein
LDALRYRLRESLTINGKGSTSWHCGSISDLNN